MKTRPFSIKALVRLLLSLAVILVPLAVRPPAAYALTFGVNTLTDAPDSNLADGVCYDGVDGCSLRAAVEQAGTGGTALDPVVIHFWSGLSGSTFHLTVGTAIEISGKNIIVDGQDNNITISGDSLASGEPVFKIDGSFNTLQNLTVRDSPGDGIQVGDFTSTTLGNSNMINHVTLLDNDGAAVYVHGSSSSGVWGNTIQSCLIGTSSTTATSCVTGELNVYGVWVDGAAHDTMVFQSTIVCNTNAGVVVDPTGGAPDLTQINANAIGTNGTTDMGNATQGIWEKGGSHTSIYGNLISGNNANGVLLENTVSATLTTNYIGTNQAGTAALPNAMDGVLVIGSAHDNLVGGPAAANRNIISGNTMCGVRIRDSAINNVIRSNVIGLNAAGTAAVPNGHAGVCIYAASNQIGSSVETEYQFISGNTRQGIYVKDTVYAVIGLSNWIGTASDRSTTLGNGLQGVMLDGAKYTDVTAGMVANNLGAGVAVTGIGAVGNMIWPKAVWNNRGLPIDLGNDGATRNGTATPPGPNNWLGYPVITLSAGNVIGGTACANCWVKAYLAVGNPAVPGGGGRLFVPDVAVHANAAGSWSLTLPSGTGARDVTLVACQGVCTPGFEGDSSEMSPRQLLLVPDVMRSR